MGLTFKGILPRVSLEPFAIQHLNRRDPIEDHVQYQHSFLGLEGYVSVTSSVCALWFGQYVERSTEIVATATPINQGKS